MALPTYSYKPLDLATDAIRLVYLFKGFVTDPIRCELFETWLHEVEGVPYEALSYAWGGTWRPEEITLNGCTAKVTENLHTALQHLRSEHRDRVLWVDAICIDQDNEKERGHQVGQMKNIYANAEQVIIWLGRSNGSINLLMDSMNQVHSKAISTGQNWRQSSECWQIAWPIVQHQLGGTHHTELNAQVGEAFQQLLRRPWFRRVWVIQEVASARAASIMCGWKTISTRTFTQIPPLLKITPDAHTQAVLDVMPGFLRKSTWWSHRHDLSVLLEKFYHSEANDPRDKVYALLGISSDACKNGVFQPNYERATHEVIQDTMSFLLFGNQTTLEGCELPQWTLSQLLEKMDILVYELLKWSIENGHHSTTLLLMADRDIEINRRFMDERTLLSFLAPKCDHGEMIKAILACTDVDVNLDLPLTYAVRLGEDETIRLLLAHKDIDADLGSPLAEAAKLGRVSAVQLLLAHKHIDVNLNSPLAEAATRGYDEIVRLLLARDDIDINLGEPLAVSAIGGYAAIVEMLLEHKDIDVHLSQFLRSLGKSESPDTTISNKLITMLLSNAADLDYQDDTGRTPLSKLAWSEGCLMSTYLLDKGAKVDSRDNNGRTALSWAAENTRLGDNPMIELLLERHAHIESRDNNGRTPLSWAAEKGPYLTVRMLVEQGARLESQDDNGRTALSWASSNSRSLVSQFLVEKRAKLESRDNDGRTPLSWAAGEGRNQVAQYLVGRGANIEWGDNSGRSPVSWALINGHLELGESLLRNLSHGVDEDD
ncbi:hypothetical protein G7Z17_g674 [Cylindrodendrum hubeiense]|uniref:Heterokaryon incompatibility domain-containing protein n=1 Tax=Cylindrodendrum hubeiense TaxID=595255 RepID=A0A9P5HL49_9HYPO|nr:hypothetical protein G7Z17_g674 [Cylindrodendrum hubeiense]